MPFHHRKLNALLLSVFIFCLTASCSQKDNELFKRTQFLMGTLVEITVREPDQVNARSALSSAFDEMRRLEKLLSAHRPDSEISRLNASAGGETPIQVSPEVLEVIQRGIHWGQHTRGALDISIGPASNLWNFESESPSLPETERLAKAIALVDFREIEIEGNTVRLRKTGMYLRLGAIAKGYAVDRAMTTLSENGIRHALINAGGDLKVRGQRKDGQPWHIGLQHPRQPEKMIASFSLTDRAVATSGDYQKYFMKGDARYHHILNPANGMPAEGMISATVVADTVMDADALATAVFVLGPEKALPWVNTLDGVEMMMVTEPGTTIFSKNFKAQPGFVLHDF